MTRREWSSGYCGRLTFQHRSFYDDAVWLDLGDPEWRAAVLLPADAVSDAQLGLAVLERGVASGHDVPESLQEIVRRRLQLGDFEAAYEGGLRAIRYGVHRDSVRDWVGRALDVDAYQVAETELAAAELSWELTRHGTDTERIIRAMRRLAKDRLLLARDEAGALELWGALISLRQADVLSIVDADLLPSLGHAAAIERLVEWGAVAGDPKRQGSCYAAAGYLCTRLDDFPRARAFVERALACDPGNADALFVAESQMDPGADYGWLDEIYGIAETATFGQHGARALHYRAARVLEAKGAKVRALRHACAAFAALPSAGFAFRLMASLSCAIGDAQPLVDAIWSVASRSATQPAAHWIGQAIEELERTDAFLSARFELLLRALALDCTVSIVQKAARAAKGLLASSATDGEVACLRLSKALRGKLDGSEGPQGARLALAIAVVAVSLGDLELCLQGLAHAFQCDADIDEYTELEPVVAWLSQEPLRTKALLNELLDGLDKPYVNVGFDALKVLGSKQLACGATATFRRRNDRVARFGKRDSFLAWVSGVLGRAGAVSMGSDAVVRELIQTRLQEHRLDDAVQLLRSIVTGNSRTILAYESARQAVLLLGEHRNLEAAKQWVQSVRENLLPVHAATLELELARQSGEGLPLVQALARVAYSDPSAPGQGLEYLREATALADRLGFTREALECAKAAVAWDPNDAEANLRYATMLYKTRDRDGEGYAEESVSALRHLPVQSRPEDEEARAFLLAEALDAAYGSGTGTDELVRAHGRLGSRPLLALGLAERLLLSGDNQSALVLFESAIGGDLRGLRSRASVCLEASRVARSEGQLPLAHRWLQLATGEDSCPKVARELLSEVEIELGTGESASSRADAGAWSDPARRSGEDTAEPGREIGRDPLDARRASSNPLRDTNAPHERLDDDDPLEIPLIRRRTEQPPSTPRRRGQPPHQPAVGETEAEPESIEEAVARARFMIERASPSYQTLMVLRRWLRHWPGSTELMAYLRDAAFVERDIPLSRAVEHARGVLLRAPVRIEPPDLCAQPVVPDAVQLLLAKDLVTPVGEAIAMLWEGAEHLLQRDLMEYGVTGLDRVVPNASNPLWQVASELAPRLDLPRVPLFYRKSSEPASVQVALSSPTAVVLQGELPRNVRELQGLIGASLWITQPEYSLLMSAPAEAVKTVLLSLQLAFGPPQRHPITNMSESLRLAEKLWECIPSSAQRQLRELCLDSLDYTLARERAQRAQRRAGLYATGDLHWALVELSRSEGSDVFEHVADPNLAEKYPRTADLLRLATSAEYAAVRWQPSRGSERRIDVPQR